MFILLAGSVDVETELGIVQVLHVAGALNQGLRLFLGISGFVLRILQIPPSMGPVYTPGLTFCRTLIPEAARGIIEGLVEGSKIPSRRGAPKPYSLNP